MPMPNVKMHDNLKIEKQESGVDSFEDLSGEFRDIKKMEEFKEKEARAAEAEVKVFMNNQLVFDDYISNS